MDLFEKCGNLSHVRHAREMGLYPYFHQLTSGQDTVVCMEGKQVVMIGSNNYLGLTSHPEVIEAGVKALETYGSGCSGSRFLNGTLDLHVALETELADFLCKEDAVTFGTGFQSNLAIISALVGRNDYVICDRENHASIYDACRLSFGRMLRYQHNDMADLERLLAAGAEENKGMLIVTDGVFSMSGDIANLPEIVRLARQYGARILVDDAHGLGVLGTHGRGTAEYFGLEDQVDLYMGTFSKSLASLGGYLACSHEVAEFVRHTSRPFIFSASMPPACVQCARTALSILRREPERVRHLSEIAAYVRGELQKRNISIIAGKTPIIPIYTYDDDRTFLACKLLLERGVYVNPVISPATPVGESLLRTSYTATHTKEQMDFAVEAIAAVLSELPPASVGKQ